MGNKQHAIEPTPVEPGGYAHLPEPVSLDRTVTSAEASSIQEEKDDYWREVEWMLRATGGG